MEKAKYFIYKIHYGILSNSDLYTEVSDEGLTESESLLKEDIKKKRKSIEGYVLYGIEGTGRKSDRKEIISNTLNVFS
ncbi:MAG: hypothetical protein NTU63_04060 [Candidatus Pacearchaeota archaeon]|nr:hypothetical protein [Candidatus Pacearchaeota archaeon]